MLKLAEKISKLTFSKLMEVYLEGNLQKAELDSGAGLYQAEQDFYVYLREVFFPTPGAVYAIWEDAGRYASALRLEPYRDGLILSAVETAPALRRRGYARKLIQAVQAQLSSNGACKLYSHVHKQNTESLKLHEGCGFRRISEQAVYLDGSVNNRCCTLLWESNTAISD